MALGLIQIFMHYARKLIAYKWNIRLGKNMNSWNMDQKKQAYYQSSKQ